VAVTEPALIQLQKASLRKAMRQQRRHLDAAQRAEFNTALNRNVLDRLLQLAPCLISAYLAFDGEPDLSESLARLRAAGFQLALPFIEKTGDSSRMVFRLWQPDDALSENPFGFAEPAGGAEVNPAKLGVILMPLVAWDAGGARLGMGAGYYDKVLEPLRDRNPPLRVGIAFDVQKSDGIPTDPHDVPLHELISNSGRFTFTA
jgi:5-formyltetrahydrofolate cyclo-ligase